MNIGMAAAMALLFFASVARADSQTDPNGTLFFPDGSVITSDTYVASTSSNSYDGYTAISFTFPGGTGSALNEIASGAGESGTISFSQPVYGLLVGWQGDIYMNFNDLGSEVESVCDGTVVSPGACGYGYPNPGITSGSVMVSGPVSEITWDTLTGGAAGISSLSDPVEVAEPPLGSLVLLGLALVGLIGLFRRNVGCVVNRHWISW
jgi:hypothetical protein